MGGVACLLACWHAPGATGRELHVNNLLGDDLRTGLEPQAAGDDGPVRTIGRAIALALPSDRVIVANTGVPYREAVSLAGPCCQGSQRRPFILESDGAVIDGTVTAERGAWRPVAGDVFALRPRRLAYQRLFRDGAPLSRRTFLGAAPRAGIENALDPMQWTLAGGELLLRVEPDKLPQSYDLRHAGLQTGITLYGVRHVVVQGFVIQGFQQDGVNAHDGVRSCQLTNLELRANGRSGLSVGGASRVVVQRSRVYDNGAAQLRTEGLGRIDARKTEVEAGPDGLAPKYRHRGRSLTVDGAPVLR